MKKVVPNKLFNDLKEGSDSAFKRVYIENRRLFLNFGKKFGLAEDDLMDIYQDACIVLFESVRNGKLTALKSSISTYLISIGKYKILERLRKNKRTARIESLMTSLPENEVVEPFEIHSQTLTPEQQILRQCFEKLGEKCKAILTMFYFGKYKIRQIMEEGNYNNENVVKSQKSRCLKQLKELCAKFSK